MEELNIVIEKIGLSNFQLPEEKKVVFSLTLGKAIVINGIALKMSGYLMPQETKEAIINDDLRADAKFCDYPVKHFGEDRNRIYPEEQVCIGMNEIINGTRYEEICDFLNGKKSKFKEPDPFLPAGWKGPLEIPIQFIRISRTMGRCGVVQADIHIGHHIKVAGIKIFPEFRSEGRILDKRIVCVIEEVLARNEEVIKRRIKSRWYDDELSLIEMEPGCDPATIPPARFLEG